MADENKKEIEENDIEKSETNLEKAKGKGQQTLIHYIFQEILSN